MDRTLPSPIGARLGPLPSPCCPAGDQSVCALEQAEWRSHTHTHGSHGWRGAGVSVKTPPAAAGQPRAFCLVAGARFSRGPLFTPGGVCGRGKQLLVRAQRETGQAERTRQDSQTALTDLTDQLRRSRQHKPILGETVAPWLPLLDYPVFWGEVKHTFSQFQICL